VIVFEDKHLADEAVVAVEKEIHDDVKRTPNKKLGIWGIVADRQVPRKGCNSRCWTE
jgi:hypothetical protein